MNIYAAENHDASLNIILNRLEKHFLTYAFNSYQGYRINSLQHPIFIIVFKYFDGKST